MADDEQTSPEPVAASGRSVELTLVERIVTAVSMALRSDPAPYPGPDSTDGRALPPLTDTVDAEALETVVSDLDDGEIRLRYAGCRSPSVAADASVPTRTRVRGRRRGDSLLSPRRKRRGRSWPRGLCRSASGPARYRRTVPGYSRISPTAKFDFTSDISTFTRSPTSPPGTMMT